jgi:hypothetical protein
MRQHRQIHIWITESDYVRLREQSAEEKASVSAILRRLIRLEHYRMRDRRPGAEAADEVRLEALQ